MGWSGGTDIFDAAVEVALRYIPLSDRTDTLMRSLVRDMYIMVDWADWDTQDESEYFEEHLIHVMYERGELDKAYYDEYQNFSDYN